MTIRIKNWEKFQHYQSGRGAPPWIKLYRDLLNDKEWYELDPAAAKFLISVWILAAETNGILPDSDTLAWRLRLASNVIAKYVSLCSHWLIDDASKPLAECYQLATPETEKNKNIYTGGKPPESLPEGFELFWKSWPAGERKQARSKCLEVWKRKGCEKASAQIISHVESLKTSEGWRGGYVPAPLVYLNQARWDGAEMAAQGERRVAL